MELFDEIGGMETIDKLVDHFYEIMQTDPLAKDCLATHAGKDFLHSAEKLKFFLSGWLGGPQLYMEKYGHPRLRMRHFPFRIGQTESQQWLYCMQKALAATNISNNVQGQIFDSMSQVAVMLINQRN